jgi:hypothetical protein
MSSAKKRQAINFTVFAVLMASTWFRLWSPWGLLFIYWIIPNFYSGRALLVFEVAREESPLLFWLVQITWLALGIVMILMDFLPGWA